MFVLIIIVSTNFFVSFISIPRGISQTREAMKHSYKYRNCFSIPDHAAYVGKHVGLYIKDNWPAKATIALNVVGAIPYFSGLRSIDMLGLNDYTIAQREISYDYSLLPHNVSEFTTLLKARAEKIWFTSLLSNISPGSLFRDTAKVMANIFFPVSQISLLSGLRMEQTRPVFWGTKKFCPHLIFIAVIF